MATLAERKLANLVYTREMRQFNFKKCMTAHVSQHITLSDLVEHGSAGINEQSKVQHLLDRIKTNKLDSIKTRVFSNETLHNNFDKCVNLFKDFIKQARKEGRQTLNISAINLAGNKVKVDNRYYTNKEYCKLSNEQKEQLCNDRKARGHKSNKRKWSNNKDNNMMQKISKIVAEVFDTWDKDKADGKPTEVLKDKSNRNNPNLKRQARNS